MSDLPPTQPSLVVRLRDAGDADAWVAFVEIYSPVLHSYVRRCGLQGADAEDVVQEVLRSVHTAMDRFCYDPHRGTFRGWLFTIARNQARNWLNRRHRREYSGGTTVHDLVQAECDPVDDEEEWNREHERHLFEWAVKRLQSDFRSSTWKAFWGTAVDNRPAEEVATELGITAGAVYVAKSRVLARIREVVRELEAADP